MQANHNSQLRAYAATYGTAVGAIWVLSFALFIVGLRHAAAANISLLAGIASIAVATMLVRNFRLNIRPLRFATAWRLSLMTYLYATLLMAVAQYIYFRYIDGGYLAQTYTQLLQEPQAMTMLQAMWPEQEPQEIVQTCIDLLQTLTPSTLTMQFLMYNLMLALILSWPTALISKPRHSQGTPSQDTQE